MVSMLTGIPPLSSGDPVSPEQRFDSNTYYQVLYVEPYTGSKKSKQITTSILAKKRGHCSEEDPLPESFQERDKGLKNFSEFQLDQETVENLKSYPRQGQEDKLSSYLPSPGVIFPDKFLNSFIEDSAPFQLSDCKTELGNFYSPIRFLLHSRKISQLIAKTWWSYLEAKKDNASLWKNFINGEWHEIPSKVLDGLVAREIFLYGGADSPDNPEPEETTIYSSLKPKEGLQGKNKFLILPSSKAWQGISLSLLLAGQAYYQIGDQYHQVSPSILSTSEITIQYALEVDWSRFTADIKEIIISHEKPWVAYQVVMPYPPIPAYAELEEIEGWAYAKEDPEEESNFPFYKKDENGDYLIDVDYFRPPYPYIPLSST